METLPIPHDDGGMVSKSEQTPLPLFAPKAEFLSRLRTVQAVTEAQPQLTTEIKEIKTEKTNASVLEKYQKDGKKVQAKGPVLVTTLEVKTVKKDVPAQAAELSPEQESSPLDALVQRIEETSSRQEKKLHKNAQHMVEMVQSAGSLVSGTLRIFSMAAAACPHCISATAQMFSGGLFGGLRGHYHKDGTFHADDDSHHQPDAAGGFWLDWMKAA